MIRLAIVRSGTLSSEVARPGGSEGRGRPVLLAALLVLLNTVAIGGQAAWFHQHVTNHNGPEDWAPAVAVALVVEMIGVYLAGMAHAARMADQYAGFLQAGAYGIGALAGALNFAHFHNTIEAAITFGALSAISPWLWAIYSRHVNRERIKTLDRAPSRRFWHPFNMIRVTSHAAWRGIANESDAVVDWELNREMAASAPTSGAPERPTTPTGWVALADQIEAANPDWNQVRVAAAAGCTDRHIRACRKAVKEGRNTL